MSNELETEIEEGLATRPTKEQVLTKVTKQDIEDTQTELFNIDDKMRSMLRTMNLSQRKKVNKMIEDFMNEKK